eukprot:COSAG02_NODE_11078_length_1797_cov_460.340989_2_plen_157_part_00
MSNQVIEISIHRVTKLGITPASMQQFDRCFIVPRAFSLQGGSYDTRSKDFQLQVSYRDGTPVKNKLWHIFVSHIRSLIFGTGISTSNAHFLHIDRVDSMSHFGSDDNLNECTGRVFVHYDADSYGVHNVGGKVAFGRRSRWSDHLSTGGELARVDC